MTDIRPQIAVKIRISACAHAIAFPNGDWRGANNRLGALRMQAMSEDAHTMGMGNEMCAKHLVEEWAADNEI